MHGMLRCRGFWRFRVQGVRVWLGFGVPVLQFLILIRVAVYSFRLRLGFMLGGGGGLECRLGFLEP